MNGRYSIVTLSVGAALALGVPISQARMVSDDSATSQAHVTSSQALKALGMRWTAIAKSYEQSQAHSSYSLRPDNRTGRLGV
jgi:hypothetical protein